MQLPIVSPHPPCFIPWNTIRFNTIDVSSWAYWTTYSGVNADNYTGSVSQDLIDESLAIATEKVAFRYYGMQGLFYLENTLLTPSVYTETIFNPDTAAPFDSAYDEILPENRLCSVSALVGRPNFPLVFMRNNSAAMYYGSVFLGYGGTCRFNGNAAFSSQAGIVITVSTNNVAAGVMLTGGFNTLAPILTNPSAEKIEDIGYVEIGGVNYVGAVQAQKAPDDSILMGTFSVDLANLSASARVDDTGTTPETYETTVRIDSIDLYSYS